MQRSPEKHLVRSTVLNPGWGGKKLLSEVIKVFAKNEIPSFELLDYYKTRFFGALQHIGIAISEFDKRSVSELNCLAYIITAIVLVPGFKCFL